MIAKKLFPRCFAGVRFWSQICKCFCAWQSSGSLTYMYITFRSSNFPKADSLDVWSLADRIHNMVFPYWMAFCSLFVRLTVQLLVIITLMSSFFSRGNSGIKSTHASVPVFWKLSLPSIWRQLQVHTDEIESTAGLLAVSIMNQPISGYCCTSHYLGNVMDSLSDVNSSLIEK